MALEDALRQAIRDRRLAAGEWLPSSRALTAQLGLARGTVVEVYSQLAAEGYLRTRPGAVTEVAQGPHVQAGLRSEPPPARIFADFRLGRPDLSTFPRADWLRALPRALHITAHSELGPWLALTTELHDTVVEAKRRGSSVVKSVMYRGVNRSTSPNVDRSTVFGYQGFPSAAGTVVST